MKFIKYVFLSTFLTCICCVGLMEIAHACVTHNDSNKTCGGLRPPACSGSFCKGGIAYECRSGCYCTGGMSTATSQNIENMCANHQDPGLTNVGIYLCPDTHPHSNSGAGSVNDCYQLCNANGYNVRYASYQNGCGAGKYLQAAHENCEDCPPGKYCDESSPIISSCTSDQGITGSCTGNKYSTSGAQVCSICNGEGRAVKKNSAGTLNIGCDVCADGTYANDGHTACETCEAGYACTNGVRNPCTGNQYSEEAGASQCTECTGNGKAVVKNGTLNVGCDVCPLGKYANADHTQCVDCPAGHACSNGVDNGLCPSGTCSAYQGHSGGYYCVDVRGAECKTCSEIDSSKPYSIPARTQCVKCDNPVDYYENGECQNCPNVPYNTNLYSPVRIDEQSGTAMCGIKLIAGNCDISENDVSVKWHIVNDAWKLVEEFSVKANMWHYVKDPLPTSPDGSDADADWCGECPTGKFNIYANRTGESACVACPVGYCTSNNSCDPCTAGYYCPGTNGEADSCVIGVSKFACPKGSFSAPGQVSCTKCASGYTTQTNGTSYNPDDDLNQICKKIKIKLNFGGVYIRFPDMDRDIFKNVKMNASVLQPQQ